MAQRYKIDRAFLRAIKPDGSYQDYADSELRGFAVKVAPGGTISYTIRWRKPDGRQGRRVIGYFPAMNPGDARELARKEMQNVDKEGETTAETLDRRRRMAEEARVIGTGFTLGTFLDKRYGAWLLANNKSGQATLTRLQKAFAEFLDRPLNDFNAWIIEKWRSDRLKSGLAAATTNRDLGALRGLFSRAVEWDLIAMHPLGKVKALRESGGKIRWLSPDEEIRLRTALDAREERERAGRDSANKWRDIRGYDLYPDLRAVAFTDYLKPAVLLSLNTGLRRGELFSLRRTDVNLEQAVLTVRDENSKSGKMRHIPLNDEALTVLRAWMEHASTELVFPNPDGERLTTTKTAWMKVLKDAEITNFRWHDMRHHFASRLVMVGVDLNTVRELLGHADLKMTLRYAHLAPEYKAAAVAKLSAPAAGNVIPLKSSTKNG
ncbi:site-specific integrase [Burkholderia cenocepacia]|uniref:site-specific integrase n=1 Tax=Burkholderia cenocepacia TaxID=95486 RepID=UPI001F4A2416|nr:site-specific integrase [Burkholderia cenocepacia]